jgi:phospholipid/cholesterol/gamma-HCH transport system substrate-binding protein
VGAVSDIQLAPDGKSVTIYLQIYKSVKIYSDAQFVIEQAGFLGDNFVAVLPTNNQGPPLADGADVPCEPPFDLQAVARSATGFIERIDDTVKKIEASVAQLQATVLNEQTLTNLSVVIANLRTASDSINSLVVTNGTQVNLAVSNLVYFSQQLTDVGSTAQGIVATNGAALSSAITNLVATTATLKQIADETHAGKGLAGTILENQQMADNLQTTVNNLAVASSNLNELGLWHFLWHHQVVPPFTNAPAVEESPTTTIKKP